MNIYQKKITRIMKEVMRINNELRNEVDYYKQRKIVRRMIKDGYKWFVE